MTDGCGAGVAGACAPIAGGRRRRLGRLGALSALLAACLPLAPVAAHAQYHHMLSTITLDASTGNVLSQDNPDLQRYPASLTKLMTLYLTFKALKAGQISLDTAVPVSIHAASMEPSKLGLVPGSYFTVQQAVLGLVTKSANDAACALGELLGGGDEDAFADLMTRQAHALGMNATTFRNASGLPDPEQVTTARDLALLTRHLLIDFPDQYHWFSVPSFVFRGRMVMNHDPMLRIYPGADGLKTGYTLEAGRNLVTSAVRGNVRLVGVVLGAWSNTQRSNVMASLLDDGFRQEGVPVDAAPRIDTPDDSDELLAAAAASHHRSSYAARHAGRKSHPPAAGVALASAHGANRRGSKLRGASVHLVVAKPAAAHATSHAKHAKSPRHRA